MITEKERHPATPTRARPSIEPEGNMQRHAATTVLRTTHLTKRYGDIAAAQDINLDIKRGELYGFLGPNGSGKTTTISMILGLQHPTSGRVEILGRSVTPHHTDALQRVGSLIGTPALIPDLNARQNLELLATLTPSLPKNRVDAVLERVGLLNAAHRKTVSYSLGMKQRLGLAMALLHAPEILILDEPTNGLDPAGMKEVRELLRSLADEGTTIFLSSHLLNEIEQICDRVTMLKNGRVVVEGTVQELLARNENTVRVRVDDPSRAVSLLKAWPHAETVRISGAIVEVATSDSRSLVLYLVQHDLVPSEVIISRTSLESVFLDLTQ